MERANTISGMSGGEMSPKTQRKHDARAGPRSLCTADAEREKINYTSSCPALIGRDRRRANDGTGKDDRTSERTNERERETKFIILEHKLDQNGKGGRENETQNREGNGSNSDHQVLRATVIHNSLGLGKYSHGT